MSEDQIERRVEKLFDALDAQYMSNQSMSLEEYDRQCKAISKWADEQYRKIYPKW